MEGSRPVENDDDDDDDEVADDGVDEDGGVYAGETGDDGHGGGGMVLMLMSLMFPQSMGPVSRDPWHDTGLCHATLDMTRVVEMISECIFAGPHPRAPKLQSLML